METTTSVNVHAYTTTAAFDALRTEWNTLLQRSVINTPFSTLEWHENWWNAYHPGDLWILAFRDANQQLIGIASLFIVTSDGKRTTHFIGCEDVTDYLDLLVDRDHVEPVYTAFAEYLAQNSDTCGHLDLCNIPANSLTYTQLPEQLADHGFAVSTHRQEVCPVITLPDTFDEYLDALDKKQRKEVSRKLKIAEAQGDSIRWYIVTESDDLVAEVDKFMTLMAASHPEKAQFLQDEAHVAFFQSLVPAAARAGWLQLNFLEVAGVPVAAYLNFDYNNRIWVYNSGLDPDKASALSPGIILLAYNIDHAIQQGRAAFDFLRGDEQYKYRMGATNTEIFNLKAGRV